MLCIQKWSSVDWMIVNFYLGASGNACYEKACIHIFGMSFSKKEGLSEIVFTQEVWVMLSHAVDHLHSGAQSSESSLTYELYSTSNKQLNVVIFPQGSHPTEFQ